MQEFFVDNFRVDILRNQIVHEGESIALEPKVLEVLKLLAEKHGEVVSHDELLNRVWPNVVVAPNALQRCIGQLRKALNDDGKTQSVIVTHPKKGYSLVAKVTFRAKENKPSHSDHQTGEVTARSTFSMRLTWTFSLLVLLVLAGYFFIQNSQHETASLSQFIELTPITATDSSEYYSTFSPNGQYVAFSRSAGELGGHFWLKDIKDNREIRITQDAGNYGQPNWSTDGTRLAYLNNEPCSTDCSKNVDEQRCVDINSLYIPLASVEPQKAQVVARCLNIPIQGLQWISKDELVYIQHSPSLSELVLLNTQTNISKVVFGTTDKEAYALSYSVKSKQLAIMLQTKSLSLEVLLFDVESGQQSLLPFTTPLRFGSWLKWYPVWNANSDGLLFSASNRLYQMDLEGNLDEQLIPTFLDVSRPSFHPDGQSIAMTLGKVDRDIAQISIDSAQASPSYSEKPLARSILRETDAQYQPSGDAIAFLSERSGAKQLWLKQGESLKQLSTVGSSILLRYYVWSPNGKQLAAIADSKLLLFDLHGPTETLELGTRALRLFQWTSNNHLLMSVVNDKGIQLVSFDMNSGRLTNHYDGPIKWAQFVQSQLVVTERDDKFKAVEDSTLKLIDALAAHTTPARFFTRNDTLFLLNSEKDLYRYAPDSKELSHVFRFPDSSIRISDVDATGRNILISKHISAKKEIVLLRKL